MDAKQFVPQLARENEEMLSALRCPLAIRQDEKMNVRSLLKTALKNEIEATGLAEELQELALTKGIHHAPGC